MSKIKFGFFFIILLFSSVKVKSEVLHLTVEPSEWSKEQFPTIIYEVTPDTSLCEYIIDNILDNTPSGTWAVIENFTGTFNLSFPLQTGEYEFWMRTIDKEGSISQPQMTKVYVDITPPPVPSGLQIKKVKDKYFVYWNEVIDKGSAVDYYEGTIGEEKAKIVKSGEWEVNILSGKTYKVQVWAIDKAGNQGEAPSLTYYLPEKLRKTEGTKGVEIFENWTISGYRSLVYRDSTIKGNITTSEGTTIGSNIEQSMVLTLRGLLPGELEVNTTIEDIPATDQNILIELKKQDKLGVKLGNFETSMSGGEFTTLATKSITGVEAFYRIKNLNIKAITSRTRSLSRTEIRQGANIKGPYQIFPWIVEGSEQVKINDPSSHPWPQIDPTTGEVKQISLSDTIMIRDIDYVIDPIAGEITFTNVVWNTATITVTFEYTIPFSLNTGDLFGSQFELFLKDNSRINLTYLQETANQSGALNTASVNNKDLPAPNNYDERTKEYILDNWPIVERTETVRVNQEMKNNELDYPGQLGGHYFMDYDRGVLRFKDNLEENWKAPYNNEEIKVTYNYSISFQQEEQLSELNKETVDNKIRYKFSLLSPSSPNNKRIRVWLDKGTASERLLIPINDKNPQGNYTVDPQVTYVEFSSDFISSIPDFKGERITVEYREVPADTGNISQVKRNVWGVNSNFKIAKIVNVESEFAVSSSDRGIYGKPQAEEFTTAPPLSGPYKLSKVPLIPGSETIEVNGNKKNPWTDYYIDYNSGTFNFMEKVTISEGDLIKVSYRYLDPAETTTGIAIIKGNAFRIRATSNIKKLGIEGSYRYVEPEYLPAGANRPTPEDENIFLRLNYAPHRILSQNFSFSQIKKPVELENEPAAVSGQIITSKNISSGLTLTPARLPRMTLNYQNSTQKDNLKISDVNTDTYSLNLYHTIGKLKSGRNKIITNLDYSKSTSSTSVNSKSDRDTESKRIKLELNPYEYVTLSSDLGFNTQTTTTPTTTNIDDTTTSKFVLNLRPGNLYNITTSYDLQRMKRSQDNKHYSISTIEGGFALLKPIEIKNVMFRKNPLPINTLTLNYSYKEDPSSSPGGTITRTTSSYIVSNLTKKLSQSLNINFTSSKQANKTGSESSSYNIGYNYKPGGKMGVNINLSQVFSNTRNYSLNNNKLTSTTTNSYSTNFTANLIPFKNLNSTFTMTSQKQKSPTNNTSNSNYSLNNRYNLGGKLDLINSYSFQKTKGTTKSDKQNLTLGLGYNFTQNANVSLDINLIDYKDKTQRKDYNVISWILKAMINF